VPSKNDPGLEALKVRLPIRPPALALQDRRLQVLPTVVVEPSRSDLQPAFRRLPQLQLLPLHPPWHRPHSDRRPRRPQFKAHLQEHPALHHPHRAAGSSGMSDVEVTFLEQMPAGA